MQINQDPFYAQRASRHEVNIWILTIEQKRNNAFSKLASRRVIFQIQSFTLGQAILTSSDHGPIFV